MSYDEPLLCSVPKAHVRAQCTCDEIWLLVRDLGIEDKSRFTAEYLTRKLHDLYQLTLGHMHTVGKSYEPIGASSGFGALKNNYHTFLQSSRALLQVISVWAP